MKTLGFLVSSFLIILTIASTEARIFSCPNQDQVLSKEKGKAACLIKVNNKLLVVKKKKNKKLDLLGGKAKKDEIAQCTAYRETWEETGLQVKVEKLLSKESDNGHKLFFIFQCTLEDEISTSRTIAIPDSGSDEIIEALWVLPAELTKKEFPKKLKTVQRLFLEISGNE